MLNDVGSDNVETVLVDVNAELCSSQHVQHSLSVERIANSDSQRDQRAIQSRAQLEISL